MHDDDDLDEPDDGGETANGRRRYIRAKRPRCPTCNSPRLQTYRTEQNGDDTVTRYARCRDCRQLLLVVVE
jgi:phage FluMu protein Com